MRQENFNGDDIGYRYYSWFYAGPLIRQIARDDQAFVPLETDSEVNQSMSLLEMSCAKKQ
ncbi:hypothetical protein MKW98_006893 [Papaver atlanticum]|uniref:Uncharacterized protein n=1 Tax=Papaver atlanticum TaxID=357466 RepID=A0AAD4SW13_9MAGN|nr:hypothetical protein MKW98_006893 [Papaver atlanticum]